MSTKIKEAAAKLPHRTKIKYRILRLAILSVVVCISALMIVMTTSIITAYNTSYTNQTKSMAEAYGEVISNTIRSLTLEIESAANDSTAFDSTIPLVTRQKNLTSLLKQLSSKTTPLHMRTEPLTTTPTSLTENISRRHSTDRSQFPHRL